MREGHDVKNLLLGAGKIYFDRLEDDILTGEVDLGDCSQLSTGAEVEVKQHFSSRDGTRGLLRETTTKTQINVSVTGHEFSAHNAAMIFVGAVGTLSQTLATVTAEPLTTKVKRGRYFPTVKREISSVVVKQGATTLVAGVDYSVDAKVGRIYFLPGGAAAEDTAATVDYSAAVIAGLDTVSLGTKPKVEGRLRYVSDPAAGPVVELILWKVFAKPNGETAWISDDYGNWQLSMSVLKDDAGHPDTPFGQVIYHGKR